MRDCAGRFSAGDPSALPVNSPVVAGGRVHAGSPLPTGTAIVTRRATLRHGRASVTLACPAGLRVADLLAPHKQDVTAAYAGATEPNASTRTRVLLLGSPDASASGRVGWVARRDTCRRVAAVH